MAKNLQLYSPIYKPQNLKSASQQAIFSTKLILKAYALRLTQNWFHSTLVDFFTYSHVPPFLKNCYWPVLLDLTCFSHTFSVCILSIISFVLSIPLHIFLLEICLYSSFLSLWAVPLWGTRLTKSELRLNLEILSTWPMIDHYINPRFRFAFTPKCLSIFVHFSSLILFQFFCDCNLIIDEW
jgi:hypothetical protein